MNHNQAFNLSPAHVRVDRAVREYLVDQPRNPLGRVGPIQDHLGDGLILVEALAAAATASHGRGNLLAVGEADRKIAKAAMKIEVDRAAAAVHGVYGDRLFTAMNVGGIHRQTEGARFKPGETGANPATYRDQVLGTPGGMRVHINRDNVDGTGLTTMNQNNGVTASQYMEGDVVGFLPDLYALTLSSGRRLDPSLTVESRPEDIVAALVRAHQLSDATNLRLAALKRGRQEDIQKAFADLGPSFIRMSDGNVVPAISAGLRSPEFPDGSRLHGTFDSGGAPEAMLLLPLLWLGGSVNVAPASKDGFRKWESRRAFSVDELRLLADGGIDPQGSFALESMFTDSHADGIALLGGITENDWVPGLHGVEFGPTGFRASVWAISAAGLSWIDHFTFEYTEGETATRHAFTPLISRLRASADELVIRTGVQAAIAADPAAARLEFEQDFYLVLDRRDGELVVDEGAFEELRGTGRYDEKDLHILRAFQQFTGWFAKPGAAIDSEASATT